MNEDNIRQIFCNNLNRLIRERNVSQREIADYVGVSYPTLNHWVKGNKIPRMDKIDKLCSFFLCRRSDLIEEPKKENDILYSNFPLSMHEKFIIKAYRKASDDDKRVINIMLNKYLDDIDLMSLLKNDLKEKNYASSTA